MDSRRRQFLKAMDIDVWVRRSLPVEEVPVEVPQVHASAVPAVVPRVTAPVAEIVLPMAPAVRNDAHNDANHLNWPALELAVKSCTLCPLHSTRTQAVFGVGNRQAQWMVIGEAPGADEDRQGEPFVGRAGQLLNSMLKAIGLAREDVYIANILKCRPPGNRDPQPQEAACCAPYLQRQIELVNPRLILCVGRIAAQNLLATDTPIGKLRGRVHRLGSRPMIVTYHPAYLLRSPGEKRKSWADLVLAMQTFDQSGTRA
jgi:uracil-DNA glycosylase